MQKCVCGRGFAPDPTGGAHDAPPDPLVGWGGDTLSQTPLGAFGASTLAPPALGSAPVHIISGYATAFMYDGGPSHETLQAATTARNAFIRSHAMSARA